MARSNWDNYLQATFCSYPIYGELFEYKFNRENIVSWFQEKYDFHFNSILEKPTKQGFLTLMSHVFYLNYFYSERGCFKLHDFLICNFLTNEEKVFLESQLILLMSRKNNSFEEKQKVKIIADKLQNKIIELEINNK